MTAVVICAIAGIGRAFDILKDAWEPLVTTFGFMIGGQMWKRTRELHSRTEITKAEIASQSVTTGEVK